MIRIISGKFGSRSIEAPSGNQTRPTTNRVREAVFSALCSNFSCCLTLSGARVLDLFSGSGALSFEALSRGADFALAFEKNRNSYLVNKKNAESLNLTSEVYKLESRDVFLESSLESMQDLSPFDIVFLDPPFAFRAERVFQFVELLENSGVLGEGALIYYEHGEVIPKDSGHLGLENVYSRSFGETCCDIYRHL